MSNIENSRQKTTSFDIYEDLIKCSKDKYLTLKPRKQIIIQILNGTIYTDVSPEILPSIDMYEISIIMYLF